MKTEKQSKILTRANVSKYGIGAVASVAAGSALAIPDASAISQKIGEGETIVDTVGGSIITVVVGMMVFGLIVGMIFRKGK